MPRPAPLSKKEVDELQKTEELDNVLAICKIAEERAFQPGSQRNYAQEYAVPVLGGEDEVFTSEKQFHPACLAFPDMDEERFEELCESIKTQGLLEPITLWVNEDREEFILDGKNRYRACQKIPKTPRFKRFVGDPWEHALAKNAKRRDLTERQREIAVVEIAKGRAKEAEKRKLAPLTKANEERRALTEQDREAVKRRIKFLRENGDDVPAKLLLLVPDNTETLSSTIIEDRSLDVAADLQPRENDAISQSSKRIPANREITAAAKTMGISERNAYLANKVLNHGSPTVVEAFRNDRVSTAAAAAIASLPAEEQEEIVAKVPVEKLTAKKIKEVRKAIKEGEEPVTVRKRNITMPVSPEEFAKKALKHFSHEDLVKIIECWKTAGVISSYL